MTGRSVIAISLLAGPVLFCGDPPDTSIPRVQPMEPAEALKSFVVRPGFRVELVASEPLIRSPVALDFDESGRLFVCEYPEYNQQANPAVHGQGCVKLLEDSDGDGRFDKAHVYADRLNSPVAVACWDGGVFVGAAPDIYYLKDTDGDNKADERRVVFTGFSRANVQGMLNSFQWGPDNRIHGTASTGGGEITRPNAPDFKPVSLSGRDFSFEPRTLDFRTESGGAQHG